MSQYILKPFRSFRGNINVKIDLSNYALIITKIDNNKKDISILGKGPTQGLEHTLTAGKMYSISFTVTKKEILFKFTLQWSK